MSLSSESGIQLQKLTNLLRSAVDSVFLEESFPSESNDSSLNGFEIVKSVMSKTIKTIGDQNRALQDGEWDTNEVSEQTIAPVYLRSEIFKNEIKEAEMMKYKLENKVF